MRDDMVKRLRDQQTKWMTPLLGNASDRIEELEAKLAKATNALRELSSTEWVIDEPSAGWCPDHAQEYVDELEAFCNWAVEKSKGTLAELTGDSDV